jgi:hypothetical protein
LRCGRRSAIGSCTTSQWSNGRHDLGGKTERGEKLKLLGSDKREERKMFETRLDFYKLLNGKKRK